MIYKLLLLCAFAMSLEAYTVRDVLGEDYIIKKRMSQQDKPKYIIQASLLKETAVIIIKVRECIGAKTFEEREGKGALFEELYFECTLKEANILKK